MIVSLVFYFPCSNPSLTYPLVMTVVLSIDVVNSVVSPGLYTVVHFVITLEVIIFFFQNLLTMLLNFFNPELCF